MKSSILTSFGLELTFMPKNPTNKHILNNQKLLHSIREGISSAFDENTIWQKDLNIIKSTNTEETILEIQTNPYTDYKLFKKDYIELVKRLKQYDMLPSSVVDMTQEGGCHINFNISDKLALLGLNTTINENSRFIDQLALIEQIAFWKQVFMDKFINFIKTYPSIVWTFLSWWDNESSKISRDTNLLLMNKGSFCRKHILTDVDQIVKDILRTKTNQDYREFNSKFLSKTNSVTLLEMRFFMMPRTIEEFDVHFSFANTLFNFIYNKMILKEEIDFNPKTVKALSSYTYQDCINEITKVCEIINYPIKNIIKVGKFDILKKRVSLGKQFMI